MRIEHDPDEGCGVCPFGCWPWQGSPATRCSALIAAKAPNALDVTGDGLAPAPEWCPLRTDAVEVSRPRE